MFDFSGQTVLMIGGLSDLAAGVAAVFKEAGADVLVVHSPGSDLEPGNAYPEATFVATPLDDPEALVAHLSTFAFQTAVICPDWFEHARFMDARPEDIDQAYQRNVEHAIYAAQAAAKRLIQQGNGGAMVFLSSVVSKMPMIETNLVGSSLASLEVIATMSAVDLAAYGIRVNVVAAGWIKGSWSAPLLESDGTMKNPADIPVGGLGSTRSVGHACCFLASPLSRLYHRSRTAR